MEIRYDHALVVLFVILFFVLGLYFIDSVFSSSFDNKYHRYDSQFRKIETELRKKEFDKVITYSDAILSNGELGTNDIRAKSYKGIAKIELGQANEAWGLLKDLIETYPGIKMVYSDLSMVSHSDENLTYIFNNILKDYVKGYKDAVNSDLTLLKIISVMTTRRWIMFGFILIGTLVTYERIRNKLMN